EESLALPRVRESTAEENGGGKGKGPSFVHPQSRFLQLPSPNSSLPQQFAAFQSRTNNNKETDQRMVVFPGELGIYVDNTSFGHIRCSVKDRSKRT
ncbi:hypothetical protein MUK42_33859, partial [Musa troglodytarum]